MTKFSNSLAAGATTDVAVTSLALVGVIFVGNVRIDMVEASSSKPVPVVDGSQAYGSWAGYQLGTILRLTNNGTTTANITVEQ